MNISVLRPTSTEVVADLRKLADEIERGELPATSVVSVLQDRVGQTISVKCGGDTLTYSGMMGLLAYASHQLYMDANSDG